MRLNKFEQFVANIIDTFGPLGLMFPALAIASILGMIMQLII